MNLVEDGQTKWKLPILTNKYINYEMIYDFRSNEFLRINYAT